MNFNFFKIFGFFLGLGTLTASGQTPSQDSTQLELFFDKAPEPAMGRQAFYNFISRNLRYPAEARDANINGKVVIKFVVNTDSTLINFEVQKGIGGGCEEEAIRVIKAAGKWLPGEQNGRKVKTYMLLPINFAMYEDSPPPPADWLVVIDDEVVGSIAKFDLSPEQFIDPKKIKTSQYMLPQEAQAKYGETAKSGAIVISTRKKKKK
ncbi:MAG: energy transducer TonB [Microscillaceae bacterium]|jgi:protein TonB|nr:energy transducer TonB [Microscillaceae bacterium]